MTRAYLALYEQLLAVDRQIIADPPRGASMEQ
jgi:hypothetical protein